MEWLQQSYELTTVDTILVAAIAFLAGIMRGFSGFGAALTIAPVLALTVGPRAAIPAILLKTRHILYPKPEVTINGFMAMCY